MTRCEKVGHFTSEDGGIENREQTNDIADYGKLHRRGFGRMTEMRHLLLFSIKRNNNY